MKRNVAKRSVAVAAASSEIAISTRENRNWQSGVISALNQWNPSLLRTYQRKWRNSAAKTGENRGEASGLAENLKMTVINQLESISANAGAIINLKDWYPQRSRRRRKKKKIAEEKLARGEENGGESGNMSVIVMK